MSKNVAHNHSTDTVSIVARHDKCVHLVEQLWKKKDQTEFKINTRAAITRQEALTDTTPEQRSVAVYRVHTRYMPVCSVKNSKLTDKKTRVR